MLLLNRGDIQMFLRTSTKNVLEKQIGASINEIANMDYDQEIKFVVNRSGKKPGFSRDVDHRIIARGNHAIASKRIMTMEDVDTQIMGWKKDERKY